jgi:hypothetical protein
LGNDSFSPWISILLSIEIGAPNVQKEYHQQYFLNSDRDIIFFFELFQGFDISIFKFQYLSLYVRSIDIA